MSVAKECGCSVTRQMRVRDEGGKWGVGGGRVNKCLQFHFRGALEMSPVTMLRQCGFREERAEDLWLVHKRLLVVLIGFPSRSLTFPMGIPLA